MIYVIIAIKRTTQHPDKDLKSTHPVSHSNAVYEKTFLSGIIKDIDKTSKDESLC